MLQCQKQGVKQNEDDYNFLKYWHFVDFFYSDTGSHNGWRKRETTAPFFLFNDLFLFRSSSAFLIGVFLIGKLVCITIIFIWIFLIHIILIIILLFFFLLLLHLHSLLELNLLFDLLLAVIFFIESLIEVRSLDSNHEVHDNKGAEDYTQYEEGIVAVVSFCISNNVHHIGPSFQGDDLEDVHDRQHDVIEWERSLDWVTVVLTFRC